ncbi:hypothetical protein EVAR_63444_1 [Eumeta japonica]|uniref:Uncharacterized protein n=1 Tax=Eumeta variegata TaxID=151549 RepID=A0A4C1YVU6_EUMVA|nr:hypothetical protein EVAR_63444_1 [Eumeta japonica]
MKFILNTQFYGPLELQTQQLPGNCSEMYFMTALSTVQVDFGESRRVGGNCSVGMLVRSRPFKFRKYALFLETFLSKFVGNTADGKSSQSPIIRGRTPVIKMVLMVLVGTTLIVLQSTAQNGDERRALEAKVDIRVLQARVDNSTLGDVGPVPYEVGEDDPAWSTVVLC